MAELRSGRNGYQGTAEDLQEIERRTQEAGLLLIATEEEVAKAKTQLEGVTAEKLQQEELLQQVQKVKKEGGRCRGREREGNKGD